MTATLSLYIAPEHLALVRPLLREGLPAGATVRVFGSRVTGRVKPYSDLDLLIDAGRRLTLDESASLSEAFSEAICHGKSIYWTGTAWMTSFCGGSRRLVCR